MKDIINAVNNLRNMVEPNLEVQNKLSSMFGFGNAFYSNTEALNKFNNSPLLKNLEFMNLNSNANWSSVLSNELDWIKSLQPISDIQRDEILGKMGVLQSSAFLQNSNLGNILSVNSKFVATVEKLKSGFPYRENIEWEERLDLLEEVIDETLSSQENFDFPPKEQIISVFRKVLNIVNNTYVDRNIELTSEDKEILKHITLFLPVISLLFANKEYADIFFKFYILWLSIFSASNDNK